MIKQWLGGILKKKDAYPMTAVALPQDMESLLLYLSVTNLRSARTIEAVRSLCPDETTTEETLTLLIDNDYVYADEDAFELTFTGLQIARQLQMQAQSESFAPMKQTTAPNPKTQPPLPTVETHPLRAHHGQEQNTITAGRPALRYLLAFEAPSGVLPIPVLDGDILGHRSDVNISLAQDEFVSGQHCRFRIERATLTLAIEDLGSRNGTFVDELPLQKGRWLELAHGSRVRIGNTVLRVVQIPD